MPALVSSTSNTAHCLPAPIDGDFAPLPLPQYSSDMIFGSYILMSTPSDSDGEGLPAIPWDQIAPGRLFGRGAHALSCMLVACFFLFFFFFPSFFAVPGFESGVSPY